MQALHEALDACYASRDGGQDAQPALDAAVKAIEKCCTQIDADQAQTLLQALHDRLLPHGNAAAEPDAVQLMQQSTERTKNALLDSVMTEALEPLASLANLGPASAALSAALVARYARCAPREAGVMLLAALGRHVGCARAACMCKRLSNKCQHFISFGADLVWRSFKQASRQDPSPAACAGCSTGLGKQKTASSSLRCQKRLLPSAAGIGCTCSTMLLVLCWTKRSLLSPAPNQPLC